MSYRVGIRSVSRLHQTFCRSRLLLRPTASNTGQSQAQSPVLAACGSLIQRWNSSSTEPYKLITVKPSDQEGVSILEMRRKPVNSLNIELMTELNIAMEKMENDKTCRGVVITSALPVFCAGLDLMEFYQKDSDHLGAFWRSFQDVVLRIYSSPLAVIAAINGPCPAGGCALAFSSDYRVMAEGKHTMGLNETQIGIAAPYWLQELCKFSVGHRMAEKMLQFSLMFTPQEALKIGAVDEVVPKEEVVQAALRQMENLMALPDVGRQVTKQMFRQNFIQDFQRRKDEDVEFFISTVSRDFVQQILGMYVASLKKK